MKYFHCFLLMVGLFSCTEKNISADLIIRGGKIYTYRMMCLPWRLVAVKDDKIIFAGSEKEAEGEISKMKKTLANSEFAR